MLINVKFCIFLIYFHVKDTITSITSFHKIYTKIWRLLILLLKLFNCSLARIYSAASYS